MPYIKREDRERIRHGFHYIDIDQITTAGELQYAIALMVKRYMQLSTINYQNCNDVMGALAGAQMEFYRQVVVPYEKKKIAENGGLYEIG